MTRPKIVDPPALRDVKKMLRDYVKKVPAAQRAKVRAATERVIDDVGCCVGLLLKRAGT